MIKVSVWYKFDREAIIMTLKEFREFINNNDNLDITIEFFVD